MSPPVHETPDAVQAARRRVRTTTVATVAASLAVLPLVWAAKATGIDPNAAVWSWVGLMGVGAAVYPWRHYSRDVGLLREHSRLLARGELGLAHEDTADANANVDADPMSQMARRIVSLAGSDESVARLVEHAMTRRGELQHDLRSLEEAIAMEASMDGSVGARHSRLTEVADARRADLQDLTDSLRDLHVELTVRSDAAPPAAVERIDHLLASLSAEAELAALGGGSESSPSNAQARPKAERQS